MIFSMGTGPSERKACGKGQRHPGLAGGNGQGIRGARAKPQDPRNRKLQLSPSFFFLGKPLNMNQEKKMGEVSTEKWEGHTPRNTIKRRNVRQTRTWTTAGPSMCLRFSLHIPISKNFFKTFPSEHMCLLQIVRTCYHTSMCILRQAQNIN